MPSIILEEVSLRDGLQSETTIFSADEKRSLLLLLAEAGLKRIQAGSFVSPARVPRMAGTEELIASLTGRSDVLLTALVLNDKGRKRAMACGLKHVSMSVSVSDMHSRKNTNRSAPQALREMAGLITRAVEDGVIVRGGIQCAFGCAYEGPIAEDAVLAAAEAIARAGATEINLADTTGMANPLQVKRVVSRVRKLLPEVAVSLHLHDTRGLGLANMAAGLDAGVSLFDTSAGGLGGCPFVEGAGGNVATEDAVNMFEAMGFSTGINLVKLCNAVDYLENRLGRSLPGRMCRVLRSEGCEGRVAMSTLDEKSASPTSAHNEPLPLAGIRVLELSHAVMGPMAGLVLADMGADVIKIEPAPRGDETRGLEGFGSGFFPYFNRNKRSLAVDLKSGEGRTILEELIKVSDVFIENFAPGTIERLGFDYARVRDLNPRTIYCTLKGFMPGPYARRPALDEVVQMMGGLAYMTGPAGRPLRAGAPVVDILGGCFGVIGILAALRERDVTGEGRLVTATLFEAVAMLMAGHMAASVITGQAPPPMPERGRTWAVYDLFDTADHDQVFIGITSDRQWERFCKEFGYMDFLADPRLATNNDRVNQREWFLPELKKRLRSRSKPEIMAMAERSAVPFAPVTRPDELFEDPQLNQSGSLAETKLPNGAKAKLPKLPLRIGQHDFGLRSDPPAVGANAREILTSLGLTEEDIRLLYRKGVIAV